MRRRSNPAAGRRQRALTPGTVLIREWQGIAHQVSVAEVGSCIAARATVRCLLRELSLPIEWVAQEHLLGVA
jgi:hypothetical protein